MDWRNQPEFVTARENQAGPDFGIGPADATTQGPATEEMLKAPIGAPPIGFDVRCIFDSRPPNAFDFNFTQVLGIDGTSSNGTFFTFLCPLGYRAVPRKWHIFFDSAPGGTAANTTGTLLNNNVAVPSNTNIILGGTGTGDTPLESFFVVEENTLFGIQIVLTGIVGIFSTNVLVYGNLLPVTNVALPFEVTNAIR